MTTKKWEYMQWNAKTTEAELDKAGAEGWELVSANGFVGQGNDVRYFYVFKRQTTFCQCASALEGENK